MKKIKTIPFLRGVASVSVLLIIIIALATSCGKKQEPAGENVFYTCSMDPQVKEKKPGKCPICKMELTRTVMVQDDMDMQGLMLSETQITLANIKTDTIEFQNISQEKILTGITVVNENKTQLISSRIPGRVERLYFKETGERIKAGQKIYEIYSEELLSAQKEYLLALEKKKLVTGNAGAALNTDEINYDNFIRSAKNKLLLWGVTEQQIGQLKTTRQTQTSFPIYSKESGIITNINIKEGDYVMEGTPVFKLADLSSLWIEAQVYVHELQYIKEENKAEAFVAAFPNKIIKGRIIFVNPELSSDSRVNLIRMEISNPDLLYQPGMLAYVTLKSNEKRAVVLPSEAVLRDSKGAMVWIQIANGSFEARMVTTGIENKDRIEITSGLKEGEKVVTSGAYLLNSEYVFKKGADPHAGMDM